MQQSTAIRAGSGSVRVPLQIGASSLASLARAFGVLVPVVVLGAAMLWGAAADWIAGTRSSCMSLGCVAVVLGTLGPLALYGIRHLRFGWRLRASDLLLDVEGATVDGGTHHGRRWAWPELEHRIHVAHETDTTRKRLIDLLLLRKKPKPVEVARLRFKPKDGVTILLAEADRPSERESLGALAECLRSPAWYGVVERGHPPVAWQCKSCGGAVLPIDAERVECPYCGAQAAMPQELRHKLRAEQRWTREHPRIQRLTRRLLRQTGAHRINIYVAIAAVVMLVVWPIAIGAIVYQASEAVLTAKRLGALFAAPLGVIAATFMLFRARLTDRQGLALLTLGFSARAPDAPNAPWCCRVCGAPLPEGHAVLLHCLHCDVENVVGVDLRVRAGLAARERAGLEAALRRRRMQQLGWGGGAVLSLALLVPSGVTLAEGFEPELWHAPLGDAYFASHGHSDVTLHDRVERTLSAANAEGALLAILDTEDGPRLVSFDDPRAASSDQRSSPAAGVKVTWASWVAGGPEVILVLVADDGMHEIRLGRGTAGTVLHRGVELERPTASGDGRVITFAERRPSGKWQVLVTSRSGGAPREVAEGRSPVVHPSGDRVAFVRTVDGVRRIVVHTLSTGDEQIVTSEVADAIDPAWSVCGTRLFGVSNLDWQAHEGGTRDGTWNLFVMDIDGDDPTWFLTAGTAAVRHPAPSADAVFFVSNQLSKSDIYRVAVPGTAVERYGNADCPSWVR